MTIKLVNPFCSVSINTKGAELISFKDLKSENEFIWNGNPEFWGKHSPVLFPIVGALKEDSYLLNGEKYNLSRHGFARDFEFEVLESKPDNASFLLKQNSETKLKYPFDFELQMNYKLQNKTLIISYTVKNNSETDMPFSLGAHPAFSLPNTFTNYSLKFEKEESLTTYELENNLFSGKTRSVALENNKLPLNYSLFKKDALVFKSLHSKNITLIEADKPVLKVSYHDFTSLGIWTVQNAPFVCIEPWIGYADDVLSTQNLFEKKDSKTLQPNNTFKASFTIELL